MQNHPNTANTSRRRTPSAVAMSSSNAHYILAGGSAHRRNASSLTAPSDHPLHQQAHGTLNPSTGPPEANMSARRPRQRENPMSHFLLHDNDRFTNVISSGVSISTAEDNWDHSSRDPAGTTAPNDHYDIDLSDTTHHSTSHDAAVAGTYYRDDICDYVEGYQAQEDLAGVGSQFYQQDGQNASTGYTGISDPSSTSYDYSHDVAHDLTASDSYHRSQGDFTGFGYQFNQQPYPNNHSA